MIHEDQSALQDGPQVLTLEPRRFCTHRRFGIPAVRNRYLAGGGGASVPPVATQFTYPDDILSDPVYLATFGKNPDFEIIGFSTANNTTIRARATEFAPTVHGSGKPIVRGEVKHCGMPLAMTCAFMTMPLDAVVYLVQMAADAADNIEVRALYETDFSQGHTKKRDETFGIVRSLRLFFFAKLGVNKYKIHENSSHCTSRSKHI